MSFHQSSHSVRLGDHNLYKDDRPDAIDVRVEKSFYHPDFVLENYQNDMALLKLAKPVKSDSKFCENISRLCGMKF